MALRIDQSVIRGEIDNREKGIVRARLWLADRPEPVVLELKGNACSDVAGCLLTFENPEKSVSDPHLKHFSSNQRGTVGDITASRKVRISDVSFEEAEAMLERGEKPPEHTANSFYLEWFSEENGRVVIESVDYRVQLSPPVWQFTKADEAERAKVAEEAWAHFSEKLTKAIEKQRTEKPEDYEDWDEFDHERAFRESDALTDKYMELLDKYGDTPDKEALIAKEMGWLDDDEDDEASDKDTLDENKEPTLDVDEINRLCQEALENPVQPDPATEGVDWIRVNKGEMEDICHPLQNRCFESSMKLWDTCDELGLSETEDEDLVQLMSEFQITGAKLAGALNGLAYGRERREGAFIVAYLKRALDHLHKGQAGLEAVAPKKLLPEKVMTETRQELFEIREEILRLMEEFRK